MAGTWMMRTGFVAAVVGTATLVGGCGTAPPKAERHVMAPSGTTTVYLRRSTGSYGSGEGQVVWTHGESTWQGKPVISMVSPQAGTFLTDPASNGAVAILNTAGKPVMSYDPPWGYRWPLEVGKVWTSENVATMYATNRTLPFETTWKVEAYGDITVPAGTFKAYKVVSTDSFGEVQTIWTSPQLGIGVVKRNLQRPATHPQGAGTLEGELTSRSEPK